MDTSAGNDNDAQNCGNCRFWLNVPWRAGGECHRRAPIVTGGYAWPGTNAEDWCGEWEERP